MSQPPAWFCEAHRVWTTSDCPKCDDELHAGGDEPTLAMALAGVRAKTERPCSNRCGNVAHSYACDGGDDIG